MAEVSPPPPFSLPPLNALSFAPLLFLLCLLLQPSIPASVSRPLRLALLLPTAYLAFTSTFFYRIEPVEWSIGANFRWGIFSPYFLMKTLEWSLADREKREKELAWVGFDGRVEEKLQNGDEENPVGSSTATRPNGALHALQPRDASTHIGSSTAPRSNGTLHAPRPRYASTPNSFGVSSTTSSAVATPEQLLTPSPSPPIDFLPPSSIVDAASKNPTSRLSPLTRLRTFLTRREQQAHPLRIIADASHLLTCLRGIGYAWGPPLKALPAPARSHRAFLRAAVREFVQANVVSNLALAAQVYHRDGKLALLLPFSPSFNDSISSLLARLLVGVSLHGQMLIGFAGANIVFLLLAYTTNAVVVRAPKSWGWTWRAHYDVREYPPLFSEPFAKMGDGGVTAFWGKRWHALFRSSFNALGFLPSVRLCRRLGLPSSVSKLVGALVVFALSAWMHAQALYSARHSLTPTPSGLAFASSLSSHVPLSSFYPPPWSSLSFIERYGTWIFFLAMPFAIVLETAWEARTRRRIGGWAGRVWTGMWIVGLGQAVVGRSWLALGLAHGLPPVHLWGWQRWLLPTFSLAPMPAFMRLP